MICSIKKGLQIWFKMFMEYFANIKPDTKLIVYELS